MPFVTVPILYDEAMNFFPNGKYVVIDAASTYLGMIDLPSAHTIPGLPGYVPQVTLLRIKTKEYGEVYVNLTLPAYNALVQIAETSPSASQEFTTTISGTPSSITDPTLFNITPLAYTVNGVGSDIRAITYVSNATTNTGTVTFPAPFTDGDVVQVSYRKN